MTADVRRLTARDLPMMRAVLQLFGTVFEDMDTYGAEPPSDGYLSALLSGEQFIAFAAVDGESVVGALAAYELRKFERERSEVYIYDLAVAETYRRRGIATELIEATRREAALRGAWVIFVQADTGPEDAAAIALYNKLGSEERVLHFDIAVPKREKST